MLTELPRYDWTAKHTLTLRNGSAVDFMRLTQFTEEYNKKQPRMFFSIVIYHLSELGRNKKCPEAL